MCQHPLCCTELLIIHVEFYVYKVSEKNQPFPLPPPAELTDHGPLSGHVQTSLICFGFGLPGQVVKLTQPAS